MVKFTQLYGQSHQGKGQLRGWQDASYKLRQVVKAAFTIPIPGKSLPGDLSPLKLILVLGSWDRVVSRLVPVAWDKSCGVDKYRQLGRYPHLKKAEYKYPSPECS